MLVYGLNSAPYKGGTEHATRVLECVFDNTPIKPSSMLPMQILNHYSPPLTNSCYICFCMVAPPPSGPHELIITLERTAFMHSMKPQTFN